MVKILSIDGGGIRGIIPAVVLAYIEKQTGRPISSLFDYIAGTSTGGLITAMLTVPDKTGKPKYSAAETQKLYREFGGTVFKQNPLRKIKTLNGLTGPRYSAIPLERLLGQYLEDAKLSSALTNIIIPAYDTKGSTPWFFKSAFAKKMPKTTDNPLMRQVARATSAAPTFFTPVSFDGQCFIDGGVFANNPALCAYAEAQRNSPREKVLVLSLGTGESKEQRDCKEIKNWGAARWLLPLLGVIMNSASATVNYQMKALAGYPHYHRYQVQLENPQSAAMDNASKENIAYLEGLAHALIRQNQQKLDALCRILVS